LPRTTVYISSQEETDGICLLGDVVNDAIWPYHRKCTLHLQPPEQQEAMTKNFKYHSPEYRAIKNFCVGSSLL
jgi:hypothetical protein